MKTRVLIFLPALTFTLLLANLQPVNAGSTSMSSGASVRGTVKIEGAVPKPKPINMAADPGCAKQHSAPVLTQEVITDGKGDLQNVVVFISDGLGDRTFDPPTQPMEVKQKGCMYEPHVLALQANQPVDVTNDDPTTHNIHPLPANNREWNKAEIPGSKIEESFPRPEIAIPVKCNVHPWMRGYVAVFKHPYFAVTGKDGSFSLNNLPPGTYTIQAWHEKLGTASQQITIGANESKNIDFVFKSM
ncbi:MAG TPA: carboxypeptidase regulatory-like domain-containing protein [Terriglobales bacterium]|nr:carboxypeptidase regulatory-like domain-containing protein [Terriglobales bacterium]HXY15772.1 carboxypeptidase regulatory-like domain-containing protein [Terriglobales bacterium]